MSRQAPGPRTDPVNCQAMIGTGPNQIESPLLTLGLRTVDGTCNNLQPGQEKYGAADETFPRLTTPEFNAAEDSDAGFRPWHRHVVRPDLRKRLRLRAAHGQQPDRRPDREQPGGRLGCDQSRAVPVRGPLVLCTGDATDPADCLPATGSLDIPNVTTDVGLSPPFNSPVHHLRAVLRPWPGQDHQRRQRQRLRAAQGGRPAAHARSGWHRRQRRRGAREPGVHGRHPGHHRGGRGRLPQRAQHRYPVRRPEPDLHLAPVAPGVPA